MPNTQLEGVGLAEDDDLSGSYIIPIPGFRKISEYVNDASIEASEIATDLRFYLNRMKDGGSPPTKDEISRLVLSADTCKIYSDQVSFMMKKSTEDQLPF